MKYKLILFDLDGTLLDTSPGIYKGIDYLTSQLNLPTLDESIKAKFIGPPLSQSYPKYLGVTGKEMEHAIKVYRKYNNEIGFKDVLHYPNMKETLGLLKEMGYLTAVVTMKEHNVTQRVLKEAGLDTYFDTILGNFDVNSLTKAELMEKAMKELNVNPEEALMIGDTELDAGASEQIKVDYIPVKYGFGYSHGDSIESYPYVYILDTPMDLVNYLKREEIYEAR